MNITEEIYKKLYDYPGQEEFELKEYELLLNGMSIRELLDLVKENTFEKNSALIEEWIFKMNEAKYGKISIGARLHNFGEFLDFAFHFSKEINPNPFKLLNQEVETFRINYTQFNALKSCKTPE